MIIENGSIRIRETVSHEPSLDPNTGYPRKADEAHWSSLAIPCQFIAREYNDLARVQGEAVRLAKYEILIEEQPLTAGMVRLEDAVGGIIGDFAIIEIQPLEAVGQIRIIV